MGSHVGWPASKTFQRISWSCLFTLLCAQTGYPGNDAVPYKIASLNIEFALPAGWVEMPLPPQAEHRDIVACFCKQDAKMELRATRLSATPQFKQQFDVLQFAGLFADQMASTFGVTTHRPPKIIPHKTLEVALMEFETKDEQGIKRPLAWCYLINRQQDTLYMLSATASEADYEQTTADLLAIAQSFTIQSPSSTTQSHVEHLHSYEWPERGVSFSIPSRWSDDDPKAASLKTAGTVAVLTYRQSAITLEAVDSQDRPQPDLLDLARFEARHAAERFGGRARGPAETAEIDGHQASFIQLEGQIEDQTNIIIDEYFILDASRQLIYFLRFQAPEMEFEELKSDFGTLVSTMRIVDSP